MLYALLGFFPLQLFAQSYMPEPYASTIKREDLVSHLRVLTSDSLQGRETGTHGQKKAAHYLAAQFKALGLKPGAMQGDLPSYFQTFPIRQNVWDEVYMEVGKEEYTHLENMLYLSNGQKLTQKRYEVILHGHHTNLNLEGKLLALEASSIKEWRQRAQFARQVGALGAVIFVDSKHFSKDLATYKPYLSSRYFLVDEKEGLDDEFALVLPSDAFRHFFGVSFSKRATPALTSTEISCKADTYDEFIRTENVIGYLEGTDKKDEILILTAHYDHLGTRDHQIYRGADDNGSGTAALLEIAEAFSEAHRLNEGSSRSILFIAMTGEEKGLLGSDYYTRHPSFPLTQTIANLNVDMIGRVDKAHRSDSNYVYLIGSDRLSSELHEISEEVNRKYTQMHLDYTFNQDGDPNRFYYRSDHYNFAKHRIPIIFYFSGVHPDYHQPTDTMDKIIYDKYIRITKLIFHTAWALAYRNHPPQLDQPTDESTDE